MSRRHAAGFDLSGTLAAGPSQAMLTARLSARPFAGADDPAVAGPPVSEVPAVPGFDTAAGRVLTGQRLAEGVELAG